MRGLGSSEAYNLFRAEALPLVDRTDCSCFIATDGYDFISGDTNPMDESSGVYHGTGVAGVIAAIIDNGQDVAGTAQVKVMALRALGLNGQGSSFNTSQAIRWAAQNGAKIINLS